VQERRTTQQRLKGTRNRGIAYAFSQALLVGCEHYHLLPNSTLLSFVPILILNDLGSLNLETINSYNGLRTPWVELPARLSFPLSCLVDKISMYTPPFCPLAVSTMLYQDHARVRWMEEP
jgi:hypothetical protein